MELKHFDSGGFQRYIYLPELHKWRAVCMINETIICSRVWLKCVLYDGEAPEIVLEISRISYRSFSPFPAKVLKQRSRQNSVNNGIIFFHDKLSNALCIKLTNFSCDPWSKERSKFRLQSHHKDTNLHVVHLLISFKQV